MEVGQTKETRNIKFKVYELDEEQKIWVEISSLGNRSFFVGHDFSFSASAKEFGTCGKNCILFEKRSFLSYASNVATVDYETSYSVFRNSGNTGLYIGVYHWKDIFQSRAIEAYPGYSDVLWPPTPWIWVIDRWKRLEKLQSVLDEIVDMLPDNFKTVVKEKSLEGVKISSHDYKQQGILLIVKEALKLMEMVITSREGEKTSMVLEKKLQESLSFQEFKDMLNQMNSSQALARESSPGSKVRLGWLIELQSALEQFENAIIPPSHAIRDMLRT